MTFDLVVRGGEVVTAQGRFMADIAVTDGKITAIGTGLEGQRVLDATGRMVMPGGVDPHCHIEQMSGMGQMNADTFETATRSAAMGGTTSVISFAAQHKGMRMRDVVADYSARAARGALVDYAFHMIASDVEAPDFADDLAAMIDAGHRSIKLFTTYNIAVSDRAILDVMTIAKARGALVCVHAENDGLIGWTKDRLIVAGRTEPAAHALSHPRLAEVEAVERMCRFAEFLDQPVMLFHISTVEGAAAVRAARGRGVPVWAETCPHYLFMEETVLDHPDGGKWMCSPPQRQTADQAALWQALRLGDLQVVSSDHAPYRYDETGKLSQGADAPFHKISNGLPGLEVRQPLMFDAMVSHGTLGPEKFVEVTSTAPAALYGLENKGALDPGKDADIVIWDPTRSHTYGADDLHDNVGYNPWDGRRVTGWPETVLLRGEVIVSDGACHAAPGSGHFLHRARTGAQPLGTPAREARAVLGD
ncbi:dihydropyrimidinase [Rubricella aquisinus]|uniref:D-hydantoinase n=1 Tax=Rubricella aquisinus TaxID=2028108 RepID=A0A840WW65_9RHOB|nr:dihydropyrimidinase [Rubricella aquisinus]MBB5514514.1 dihydropyrimidinase [Rubricella aquisinus]